MSQGIWFQQEFTARTPLTEEQIRERESLIENFYTDFLHSNERVAHEVTYSWENGGLVFRVTATVSPGVTESDPPSPPPPPPPSMES
jgi:hypothetical protein